MKPPHSKSAPKFALGSRADRELVATMEHEMIRCREAFERFARIGPGAFHDGAAKKTIRQAHDAYADFVAHLYEFYVGCFQRDRRSLATIDHHTMEQLLTAYVPLVLKRRVDAIKRGEAPESENSLAVYQVKVSPEFAQQFRRIRNSRNHVLVDRVRTERGRTWTLSKFFARCHLFMYLLYHEASRTWGRETDPDALGAVTQFSPGLLRKSEPLD